MDTGEVLTRPTVDNLMFSGILMYCRSRIQMIFFIDQIICNSDPLHRNVYFCSICLQDTHELEIIVYPAL